MSKKLFNELLTRASQPVPKEQDKGRYSDVSNEKKTRTRKKADTSVKRSGTSPKSNA